MHAFSVPRQVVTGPKFNLIDNVFQNLTSLYFKSSVKISAQYLVSQLVGGVASDNKLIGSVIPLSALESLCESSLEFKNVMVRALLYMYILYITYLSRSNHCANHLQGFLHVCKVDAPLTLYNADGHVIESHTQLEVKYPTLFHLCRYVA